MDVFYASSPTHQRDRSQVLNLFESLGEVQSLLVQTILWCRKCVADRRLIFAQCTDVGARSVLVVALITCTVGMVLALQTAYQLGKFNQEHLVGALVSISMAKELGPLMTALLIAGRIGAAMAAELGTMKVQEEIDALRSLGINPIRYLVTPRFIACVGMVPLLAIFAYLAGLSGGLFVCVTQADVLASTYIDAAAMFTDWRDISSGLIKAVFFGMIIAISACHQGLKTVGGAQEVGRATTRAVVVSFVSILVSDYFLTKVLGWTPIG